MLRDGEEINRSFILSKPHSLVPHHLAGGDPSYFVFAGIVFTTATEPYLMSEYGGDYHREAPVKLLDRLLHHHKSSPEEEVVLVSQVLASDATLGYEDAYNAQVLTFNGTKLNNLRHLVTMVMNCKDPFMKFELEYSELLVLDTKIAHQCTADVLASHSIPSAVSKDLEDIIFDTNERKESHDDA